MEMALFNRFVIEMAEEQVASASHQGRCDSDVAYLLLQDDIKRQLEAIPDLSLKAELKEYGAWSFDELQDRDANEARIIWLAADQIQEEKEHGSD